MKRYGNIFTPSFTPENLHAAYIDARKGKRNKRACFEFEKSLGSNLERLHSEIHSGTYHPMPYLKFEVFEPKRRTIYAPAFRDTVVQHALYRVVNPIFNRSFIDQSFACRKGYGTHKAADYVHKAIRRSSPESYYLQLDVRKFFASIDRGILRTLIEAKIKDARAVDVMMMFSDHEGIRGIPIGNLLSQLFALIYLNPLDHYAKRSLQAGQYARYVDDFVLIGLARGRCLEYRDQIRSFLSESLGLGLSKSTIQKVGRGINFCGYRMWPDKSLIRKHSLYKFRRSVRRSDLPGVVSLLGHAKATQSLRYMLDFIKHENYGLYKEIPQNYYRAHYA